MTLQLRCKLRPILLFSTAGLILQAVAQRLNCADRKNRRFEEGREPAGGE